LSFLILLRATKAPVTAPTRNETIISMICVLL
jgi:hypothetical protein